MHFPNQAQQDIYPPRQKSRNYCIEPALLIQKHFKFADANHITQLFSVMLSTKKTGKLLPTIILSLFCSNLFAQISYGGMPLPLQVGETARSESISQDLFVEMPPFDIHEAVTKSKSEQARFKSLEFAHKFHVFLRPGNSGTRFVYNNMKVWRVGIRSPKALSINILFSKFRLPRGAQVFIYNTDQSEILGSYTEKNNSELNLLPVQPLPGDELIVEYQEPLDAEFEGEIEVGEVNHDFRGILRAAEPRDPTQNCNPNLICYPEDIQVGSGVVALIINGNTYCTGSLINNSSNNGIPYLVTATHCLNRDYDAAFLANRRYGMVAGSIVAFFGYQSPGCTKEIRGPLQMTLASTDSVLINEKHDISLLKFRQVPPAEYQPYYPGWNVEASPLPPFHGVHHPNGGIKKVTVDENDIHLTSFGTELPYNMTPAVHWNVATWEVASTEKGSSGSPLFDKDKRIVGTLSGGDSYCSTKAADQYAALYRAWTITNSLGNPNSLKSYLDPANTNRQQIDGYNPHPNKVYTKSSNYNALTDSIAQSYSGSVPMFSTNNSYGYTEFAEEFKSSTPARLQGIFIASAPTNVGIQNLNIRIKIYADNNGAPGTLLHETPLKYSYRYYGTGAFGTTNRDMQYNVENYVQFEVPLEVSGNFYIAYSDNNQVSRGFAALNVKPRGIGTKKKATAWMRNSSGWVRVSENGENLMNTTLLIAPYVEGTGLQDDSQTQEELHVNVSYHKTEQRILIKSNNDLVAWKVFYSGGRKIFENNATQSIGQTYVPTDYWAKGLYIVTVDTTEGRTVHKVLVN